MSEDNSFEVINKKFDDLITNQHELHRVDGTSKSSLVNTIVPPPTALPTFITTSSTLPKASNSSLFHPSTFRPEIPETELKIDSTIQDTNNESVLNIDKTIEVSNSLFGWVKDTVKSSNLLNKVAETAKNSVDSVITILDPQMKDFMSSDGAFELIVASDREVEVSSIKEAFQNIFNRISIRGLEADNLEIAKQVVGFKSAVDAAFLKIETVRSKHPVKGPIIAVQNFISKISEESWYDLDLIVLQDLDKEIHLKTYSQMIPIPISVVNIAKDDTSKDYTYVNSGFSITISDIMGKNLQVHPSEWQEILSGVPRRDRILSVAKIVANLYKNTL